MDADDTGVDHLDAVMADAGVIESLEHHAPHACQDPALELAIDAVPLAEVVVQITPWRAGARDSERTVQHTSVIQSPAPAPDLSLPEEGPFLIRHEGPNQSCSPQRKALNQRSGDFGVHLARTTYGR